MARIYYAIVSFLIITYFLIIPFFIFTINNFYNQNKIMNNFYHNVFKIGEIKMISKTNHRKFFWIKTLHYLWWLIVMLTLTNIFWASSEHQDFWIGIEILVTWYTLPLIIIWLSFIPKIKKVINSNKEALTSLETFLNNWKIAELKEEANENFLNDPFKLIFEKKKKYLKLYLKWINLNTKSWIYPNDKNNYLYLFSSYLILNYYLFKKEFKKNNQLIDEKIKLIINSFLEK